jgi:hypothetical protein
MCQLAPKWRNLSLTLNQKLEIILSEGICQKKFAPKVKSCTQKKSSGVIRPDNSYLDEFFEEFISGK